MEARTHHLPDSGDMWSEHQHTSGRIFLTNMRTSETKWLWQKWDMNGRLFVRNVTNPSHQVWVDEMDFAMRIASGMATPDEVAMFQSGGEPQPFQPHYGFQPAQQPPFQPQVAQQAPFHRHFASHEQNQYQSRYAQQPQQQEHHYQQGHFQQQSYAPYEMQGGRERYFQGDGPNEGSAPTTTVENPLTRFNDDVRYDYERERVASPKRSYGMAGEGRYWGGFGGGAKRFKSAYKERNGEGRKPSRSRFASMPSEEIEIQEVRERPRSIEVGDVREERRRRGFVSTSRAGRMLMEANRKVEDSRLVGMLYERDFAGEGIVGSPRCVRGGGDEEYEFEAVVGTCQEIEKEYLRLTSAPKPEMVRPPAVLKKSLEHIKNKWLAEGDYDWACKQMKSVRQDYKVQHVENEDVVDVYETHARIALEKSDLGEFNTCVAQVQDIYTRVARDEEVQDEFAAYRILYNLLVGAPEWEQNKILLLLRAEKRMRRATKFALLVRQAVVSGNFHAYFVLRAHPPEKTLISYLLTHFDRRVRFRALAAMVAAYGPGNPGCVDLNFVIDELGFRASPNAGNVDEVASKIKDMLSSESAKRDVLRTLNKLDIFSQSLEELSAISYLIEVGAILKVEDNEKPILQRILVDCRTTKESGLQNVHAPKKLITHAGSEV